MLLQIQKNINERGVVTAQTVAADLNISRDLALAMLEQLKAYQRVQEISCGSSCQGCALVQERQFASVDCDMPGSKCQTT